MFNSLTTLSKTNLPALNVPTASFDFIAQTVGRYFEYKNNTKLIEHETQKVKEQSKIIVKNIEAELVRVLDENDKSFKQEMARLKMIGQELKSGKKSKGKLLKQIASYSKMLSDPNVPLPIKETIPTLIAQTNELLQAEQSQALEKLNLMSNFESNTKLIGGE